MAGGESDLIQGLKAIWLNRLKEAELKLRLAQDRLHEIITDLKPGDLSVTDGLSPFRQASQEEIEALREYERVLRIFTDLVEHGKVPGDCVGDQEQ